MNKILLFHLDKLINLVTSKFGEIIIQNDGLIQDATCIT
jgi:hypothetical protein